MTRPGPSLTIGSPAFRIRIERVQDRDGRVFVPGEGDALRKPRRGQSGGRTVRLLAISLLILGVGRAPLPRAEYHVIAHQDGTGRICSLHEHLLRLHPIAGIDHGQHAALHWHWALPHPANPHGPPDSEDDSEDTHVPAAGADLLVVEGPTVAHPVRDGLTSAMAGSTVPDGLAGIDGLTPGLARSQGRPWGSICPGTLARGSSLSTWLQRWTC